MSFDTEHPFEIRSSPFIRLAKTVHGAICSIRVATGPAMTRRALPALNRCHERLTATAHMINTFAPSANEQL